MLIMKEDSASEKPTNHCKKSSSSTLKLLSVFKLLIVLDLVTCKK